MTPISPSFPAPAQEIPSRSETRDSRSSNETERKPEAKERFDEFLASIFPSLFNGPPPDNNAVPNSDQLTDQAQTTASEQIDLNGQSGVTDQPEMTTLTDSQSAVASEELAAADLKEQTQVQSADFDFDEQISELESVQEVESGIEQEQINVDPSLESASEEHDSGSATRQQAKSDQELFHTERSDASGNRKPDSVPLQSRPAGDANSNADPGLLNNESLQSPSQMKINSEMLAKNELSQTLADQGPRTHPNSPRMIDQIVSESMSRMSVARQAGTADILVRLDPPELGEVIVKLRKSESGIKLKVQAIDPGTHKIIEKHSQELASFMQDFDTSIEVDIDSQTNQFQFQNESFENRFSFANSGRGTQTVIPDPSFNGIPSDATETVDYLA